MRLNSHPSGRHFLQIPGPTNVPDRILRAMDYPTIDHRGPEFNALAKKVLRSVRQVFQTKQPVIIYPASGTGAWEAALVNTLNAGDTVLMWETGHFASLWKKMADKLGIKSEFMGGDWRKAAIPPRSRSASRKTPATRSRRCASCTTRPPQAWSATSPRCAARSMPPSIRPCCWSTRSPRWARSTIATTPGASTSRSRVRRRVSCCRPASRSTRSARRRSRPRRIPGC